MNKKICLITGANAGIGKAAAIQIAQQGHHVVMACRNPQKGEAALREVRTKAKSDAVELMIVDMSLQSSIHALADEYLAKYDRLDALIHNAAIFDITQKTAVSTPESIESIWATNHVGPVLLTELLWDALKQSKGGRVITIASKGLMAKPFLKVDLDDPEFRKRPFSVEKAYYQSKRAQVMYTYWLVEKAKDTAVTVNSIRVPAVRVDISKYEHLPTFLKKAYAFKSKFALSPEEMAEVYTYLAAADEMSQVTGVYFDEKTRPVKPVKYAQQTENIVAVMDLTMRYLSHKQD